MNRREFVSGAAALSGLMTLGIPAFRRSLAASDVIQVGLIGKGARGAGLYQREKKAGI